MQALLDVLTDTDYVLVDAYPDPRWPTFASLPASVRAAQAHIADLGRQQHHPRSRDPLMAVRVDVREAEKKAAVASFGPESIRVEFVQDDWEVAGMDDCGTGCSARLTDEQYEMFVRLVPDAPDWFNQYKEYEPTSSGCFHLAATFAALLILGGGVAVSSAF